MRVVRSQDASATNSDASRNGSRLRGTAIDAQPVLFIAGLDAISRRAVHSSTDRTDIWYASADRTDIRFASADHADIRFASTRSRSPGDATG